MALHQRAGLYSTVAFPRGNSNSPPAGLATLAAMEASNTLQDFTRAANEQRIRDAAEALGADLGTVEGILAAQAYAMGKAFAESGILSDAPEQGDRARVIAEAMGLYEMYRPGLFSSPGGNAMEAVDTAKRLATSALAALEAGRLKPDGGSLSQGWVEVFPELTEDERRLGQLPGFTAERLDQWLEQYPAEELGLPPTTGTPVEGDPTGNVISTPVTGGAGPNIVEARPGEPTPIRPNDDEDTIRSIERENESAQLLAKAGRAVIQNPAVKGPKRPDYLIDGQIYDHYAPKTEDVRNIWRTVKKKVEDGQASNIVIGLQDSSADEEALRRQFADWPIEGLGDVLIVRPDGSIGGL